ncbi:MAG: nitroreductase family protein [Hyphomicrobiaceae bacterium]|nr:nitroreductase family protein [Hyphomicrobiaceae bacterium]
MNDMATPAILPSKTALLTERYGAAAAPAAGPWNDVIGSLLTHRSVRGFKSDPVPAGTLETLIAAAQSAATSSNLQTWSVVAVNDPATRAEFAKIANNQKHIVECPLFLCFLADVSRNERMGQAEKTPLEGLPYLETFLVAAIDAALAAQNAVVAAESLGLSTVYIGAMRNDVQTVAKLLGLPPGAMCVFGLCIGYAKPGAESSIKPRLPQQAILYRERYVASEDNRHRAAYDAELSRFSKAHEMSQYTWTERVLNRLGPIKSLSGRDKLKAAINALGFPLR